MIRRYKIFNVEKLTSQWLWRLLAISFFNFINLTFYLIFRAWGKWCELEKMCAWPILVGGNRIISGNIKEQSYSLCCVCNLCITRLSPVVASKARLYQYVPPYSVPMLRGSDVKCHSRDRYRPDPANPDTNFQLNYFQVKTTEFLIIEIHIQFSIFRHINKSRKIKFEICLWTAKYYYFN